MSDLNNQTEDMAQVIDAVVPDYQVRFVNEYLDLNIKYNKLKAFIQKIEASEMAPFEIEEPKHDCPTELLKRQLDTMREYINILEMRALFEKINL